MNKELIKKNYYEAVNGEWLSKAVIPGDQPQISAFLELHLGIEKTLMELASKWEHDQTGLDKNLLKFVKLHNMTKDFETREKLGIAPIKPVIDKINGIKSLKDLEQLAQEMLIESYELPFGYHVMQDFMNSNNQVMYFGESDLFLPDKSYYENKETKEQLLGMFQMTSLNILKLYGYSDEEAQDIITKALAFDELLVPIAKDSVEKADYVKLYNPMSRQTVYEKAKTFDLMALADKLVNAEVDQLIVFNPNFLEKFNDIICEENFELIKAWILLSNLKKFASDLSDELRIAGGAFNRMLSGISEAQSKEKFAFYQAYNRLSQSVGLYYGVNYFGPKAKTDVENMVKEIIAVYRERINNNNWLQQETKSKAIAKLNTISVHVGYPEELPSYYDLYEVESYEEGSNLIKETLKFARLENLDNFSKYHKEPNRNIWSMPASMVNAYYNPFNNQIVFPAAILQRPYYSLDQSPSENYGGIGAVMAHEISHAFDNNGAKFDEFGSLKDWWTKDDFNSFEEKAKDMIQLFDGVETGYGKCNGKLTVSENIADSGGLRCALEASKKHSDHNYEEFFQNWARVWRQKASPEFAKLLLTVDVHGPAVLRANMQLSNLIEFQEYYQLVEGDPMYLAKDKMVEIW